MKSIIGLVTIIIPTIFIIDLLAIQPHTILSSYNYADGAPPGTLKDKCEKKAGKVPPECLAQLTIIKHVEGGTALASDFTMAIIGNSPSQNFFPGSELGTTINIQPGSYQVTEFAKSGYDITTTSDCSGIIAAGESKICTVTNNAIPTTLIVKKQTNNTNFPSFREPFLSHDFQLAVIGNNPSPSTSFRGSEAGVHVNIDSGNYSVIETGSVVGYLPTYSPECNGNINQGETKTCTVTNTAYFGTLIINKQVVGGTASPSDFSIGYSLQCDPQFGCSNSGGVRGNEFGVPLLFVQVTYQIEERPIPGYTVSYFGDCSGRLNAGDIKTCTVINTANPTANLIVKKHVINDNGGNATSSVFTMSPQTFDTFQGGCTQGVNPTFYPSFKGSESGTNFHLHVNNEGSCYSVSEGYNPSTIGEYEASHDGCIAVIKPGETKTCTWTNNDSPN